LELIEYSHGSVYVFHAFSVGESGLTEVESTIKLIQYSHPM